MLSSQPPQEMTDKELLDLYKASGDLDLLGKVYHRYMAMVYGVCLKYLKDREASKDAVMQIFEKLVKTLREHEVTHFKSWLYATSRNHCLMDLRAQKGKKFEELSPFLMETDGPLHLEDDQEMETNLTKLEKCMEELGNEQKQCVRLFYMEQRCYKEITGMTGYDFNSVKSYIQNGKRNLKLCMERNG